MWRPISAWNPQDLAAICSLTLPLLPTKRLLLIVAAREKLNGFDSISANLYLRYIAMLYSLQDMWRIVEVPEAPEAWPPSSPCHSIGLGMFIETRAQNPQQWILHLSLNKCSRPQLDHNWTTIGPQLDHNSNKPLVLHVGLALAATPHAGTITIAKYI